MTSSAITIDRERRDNMQGNHDAPLRCLVNNVSHYYSQESGNAFQGFPELRNGDNVRVDQVLEAENPFNGEPYAYSNQTFTRPFFRPEMFAAPYVQPDFIMTGPNQTNNFQDKYYSWNHDYRFVIENKFPQMPPIKMFPQAFPCEVQDQEFQYFVVIDFEATCDKEKNLYPQEIIEFPSVLVNSFTGQLEASFQTYVRPAYHQHLTDFCKELTGIQQIQVDRGVPLSEAILMHDKWLEEKGIKHKNFAVVTWSNWDCRVMLESECIFKKITKPSYFNRWINLKVPFQERYPGVRFNLKEAVHLAGLTWEGRAHCGLDDARNTARLLVYLMHQGIRLSITNSLGGPTTNLKNQSFCDFPVDQNQQSQRSKELAGPPIQSQPFVDSIAKERYCFCGVLSSKCVIRKPGPNKGKCFFGCGKWTAARRAVCNYFVWASP